MEKKVVVSKRFRRNTLALYDYLIKEHSATTAYHFLDALQHRFEFISQHPEAGKPSQKKVGIRSIPLLPHNRIYYRINEGTIELLCLFDMRRKNRPY